ncbi:MAG TPA: SRPBCC domain-containing protein [Chitinophagaceae bacterium]|nr:SRPBCC domain-containing protein [Chitinophagaceae bacterium]
MATKETVYTKDPANKKINVVREFDAPVEKVWKAWTEPSQLDQWWAPKPWKATTQEMDFREGGHWRYYMEGPGGERHYCRADYELIVYDQSYTGLDAFCDEQGKINEEFPRMHWEVVFSPAGKGTKTEIEITFAKAGDLEKILEMGFEDGFRMAHENLDELLNTI